MDTTRVREWHQSRLKIADAIVENFGDEGKFDAEILLCCAMGALASKMWPGRGIDAVRYVQLLVDFAPDPVQVKRISVPILHEKLRSPGVMNDIASAQVLESRFLAELRNRDLTGIESDQSEETLIALLPSISLRRLRAASYAAIIYFDLRCGLVHEYSLPPFMIKYGLSRRQDVPSYVDVIAMPDMDDEVEASGELSDDELEMELLNSEDVDDEAEAFGELSDDELEMELLNSDSTRHLYLPYHYVRGLATSVAEAVFAYWDEASEWERPTPQSWWFEGKVPE